MSVCVSGKRERERKREREKERETDENGEEEDEEEVGEEGEERKREKERREREEEEEEENENRGNESLYTESGQYRRMYVAFSSCTPSHSQDAKKSDISPNCNTVNMARTPQFVYNEEEDEEIAYPLSIPFEITTRGVFGV